MDTEMSPVRHLHSWIPCILLILTGILHSGPLTAQKRSQAEGLDTLYVKDYSHLLTLRIFSSTKYNSFRIGNAGSSRAMVYQPTNQYNIGIGASYRTFTLNLGFGIPGFTAARRERLGHSRYLDAQANIFSTERSTNLFLQFFKGYRVTSHLPMTPGAEGSPNSFRDDVEQFNFGISSLRILNSKRYSYRAALNQDAWQKRSQGSWLIGAYASYYRLRADSSLVPMSLAHQFPIEASLRRGDMFDVGPMAGYTYTVVFARHFFIMASAAFGAGLSIQYLENDPASDADNYRGTMWGPGGHLQIRGGIGRNSRRTQIGLTFNHEHIQHILPIQSNFTWGVGNVRLNLVHRFDKKLGPVDRSIKRMRPDSPEIIKDVVPAVDEIEED